MKLRASTLGGLVVAGGVAAYPLVAAATSFVGVSSTGTSIAMRGLNLAAACLLLLLPGRSFGRLGRLPVFLLLLFWLLYLLRILTETLFHAGTLARTPITYWSFALGACFVPMLALAASRETMPPHRLFRLVFVPSVVAMILAIVSADTLVSGSGSTYDSGRYSLESLNPITLGHLGVTVALMAIWRLRVDARARTYAVFLPLAAVGVVVMLLAASRGPVLAFVVAILVLEIARGWRRLLLVAVALVSLVALAAVDLSAVDEILGTNTFARWQEAVDGTDPSARGRITSFTGAWRQFLDHPFTGDALEERTTGFYPHNLVLEALMATGAPGGLAVAIAVLWLLRQAARLVKWDSGYGWVALVFVQYLLGAQLSGAVYSLTQMWTLAGLIVALALGPAIASAPSSFWTERPPPAPSDRRPIPIGGRALES